MYPLLSNSVCMYGICCLSIFQLQRRCSAKRVEVFVQYVHLPPAVYLPCMWAITAHYGDNYLSYNSSYYCEMATCIMDKRTFVEKENQLKTTNKLLSFGKSLVHHFSHDDVRRTLNYS